MTQLANAILAIAPPWLRRGVDGLPGTAGKFLYAIGFMSDCLIEKLIQGGLVARLPLDCDPSCLPVIGADRLRVRGLTEPEESYRRALQNAFPAWSSAGLPRGVLREVLHYLLATTPAARTVANVYTNRFSGGVNSTQWDAYNANADTTQAPAHSVDDVAVWDWDSLSPCSGSYANVARTWLVLSPGTTVAGRVSAISNGAAPIAVTTTGAHGLTTGDVVYVADAAGALLAVTAAANVGGAIGLTTASAHGYYNGSIVAIGDVGGVPNASGQWAVTVTGAFTFTLIGSTWAGAFTSGGTAYGDTLANGRWTVTVTGSHAFTLNGSDGTVACPWGHGGSVYRAGANNWIGPARSVIGSPGVKWGDPSVAWGVSVAPLVINQIRNIVGLWRAAHAQTAWILIPFDPALFDPVTPTHYPDGRYGRGSKTVAGSGAGVKPRRRINSRVLTDSRYSSGA